MIEQLQSDSKKISQANPNRLRDSVFDGKADRKGARSRTQVGGERGEAEAKKARVLKLGGGKYYFPKRQRFNENLDAEVVSQRSAVASAAPAGRKHLANLIEKNKGEGDSKRLTSEDLSKFFSQKSSPEELLSAVTASRRTGTAEVKQRANLRQMNGKKSIDCGNKRYAASQISSFAGGLLNAQHARSTFYTITPQAAV